MQDKGGHSTPTQKRVLRRTGAHDAEALETSQHHDSTDRLGHGRRRSLTPQRDMARSIGWLTKGRAFEQCRAIDEGVASCKKDTA
jgi:hypothetical protein